MTHYDIYNPETAEWFRGVEAPTPEIACAKYGLRPNKVHVFEKGKLIRTPSKERKRSVYLGGGG